MRVRVVSRRIPFFDVRDWLMSDERMQRLFSSPDGNKIFPSAEPPEASLPFIVYFSEREVYQNAWWMSCDFVNLNIRALDIQDVYEAINVIQDYLSQGAISARDLTLWLKAEGRSVDFEYHSIEVISSKKAEIPKERGGQLGMDITIAIDFSPISGRYIKSD